MKKVSELETLVAQAKEADKGGMNFSFINSAGQYQLEAKKYVRRIRDKVPYSDWDKEQLQDANSSWMVSKTLSREHYASTTKWLMTIIACVKRF